jgi:hypothetical protein
LKTTPTEDTSLNAGPDLFFDNPWDFRRTLPGACDVLLAWIVEVQDGWFALSAAQALHQNNVCFGRARLEHCKPVSAPTTFSFPVMSQDALGTGEPAPARATSPLNRV